MNREYAFPRKMASQEVKALRKKLKLTQKEFAEIVGVSKPTVERWENSDKPITGPEVMLFDILYEHPELVTKKKLNEKEYDMQLNYMYNDKICAVIEVDERNRRVAVKNYTNILIFRPFGSIEEPTFEDYEEFIESRCFPRSRDKMKIQLEILDLPFYDPLLIIEKTQGRMAEDDFWIDIVR